MRCSARHRVCLSLTALWCSASGCALSAPYPTKALFAIDPGQPPRTFRQISPATLGVYRVRVSSPYDARTFVYRRGDSRFESDYYNGFIAPPEQLLTGVTIQWLSRAGLFPVVVSSESRLSHPYVLEGNVTEMFGDYSDARSPKAVMAARFFLIDDRPADGRVLFQKTYDADVPIKGAGPEALATAMNAAYRSILTELTEDLSGLSVASEAAVSEREERPPVSAGREQPTPATRGH